MSRETAQAVVVTARNELGVRELPCPEPGPYEAIVRVLACGICSGTDTSIVGASFPSLPPYPFVLGHEGIGEVVRCGPRARNLKPGDLVLRPSLLRPGESIEGVQSAFGGMATWGLVADAKSIEEDTPAGEEPSRPVFAPVQQVVPAGFDPHHSGIFITFKETLGALLDLVAIPNPSVLILGAGVVGLCFTRAARLIGCSQVVTLARRAEPLQTPMELGADAVIDTSTEDAGARMNELTGGRGFDYVVEAVGSNELINLALDLVAVGGSVGLYGVIEAGVIKLNWARSGRNWSIKYLNTREAEVHEATLSYWEHGLAGVERLVTHRMPFVEIDQALDLVRNRKGYKISLDFSG